MVIKTGIIPRVAFTVFNTDIYWYAVIIALAIVVGYIWAKVRDGKFGIKYDDVFNLSLFMIPTAVVCARAYYVAFNLNYYANNPLQIFNLRNGGIAIYGAIIGAIITIIIFSKVKKIRVWDILDYLAPIIPLCQAIGRWGNYVNIEAYGGETSGFIKMQILENGSIKYVHPTFLYESMCSIFLFFILYKLSSNRKFSGQIACIYFIGYAFVRFWIEALRTDSLMIGSIRVSQLLSAILFVFAIVIYINKKQKAKLDCRKMSNENLVKK